MPEIPKRRDLVRFCSKIPASEVLLQNDPDYALVRFCPKLLRFSPTSPLPVPTFVTVAKELSALALFCFLSHVCRVFLRVNIIFVFVGYGIIY